MKTMIPRLDSSLFDWLTWRNGSVSELLGFPCRLAFLVSKEGKKKLREVAVGWCDASQTPCRPKPGEIALMVFKEEHFWFHLRAKEFIEVFTLEKQKVEEKETISQLYADLDKAKERIKTLNEEKAEIEKGIRKTQNLIWLHGFNKKEGDKKFSDPIPLRISRR